VIISLDTETTGVDLAHGAAPFLVTTWDGESPIRFWEWDVDPLTRRPQIPDEDLRDVAELIDCVELIYLHNAKFDARALARIGINLPWEKVRDSLIAAHLLASNHRHDLTACCMEYLGTNIEPHELHVEAVVRECRKVAKRDFPTWKLANEGVPGMPSVKASTKRDEDKAWKNDMWLPRALALEVGKVNSFRLGASEVPNKNWLDACSKYANADSEHTLPLGREMERLIRERGCWSHYEHRLKLMRADCEMELCGVTALGDDAEAMAAEYGMQGAELQDAMVALASEYGHKLELAEGAALNDNMRDFFYGSVHDHCPMCGYSKRVKHWNGDGDTTPGLCPKCAGRKRRPAEVQMVEHVRSNLNLQVIGSAKTGNASLDADAIKEYLTTLDDGPALEFIEMLADKRMYGTALGYIQAYRRYWVPVEGRRGYFRIHASINPCGTDHLRQACNSPNLQNVSGESKELSNRACFGPLPDREWWGMDYKSIENRIPAYESGEEKMIELFERPNVPPFFGSYYLLNASITCPDLFWPVAEREGVFKREYPGPYKSVKFGTLAMQYGCGRAKADKLFKMRGAFDILKDALPKLTALQYHYLTLAERTGWVQTIPSRAIDPERGYPILASRTDDGRVLSTTPFNYHVSGTACECKNLALVRCTDKCMEWREEGFDAWVALEVHDEILFDFPRGATPDENMGRAMVLKGLMEQSGEDLVPRIPLPVSVTYHARNWGEGKSVN
jgi:DNA polymerase family A